MKKPIRIEHISKKYKSKLALDNVSFSLEDVGITGLIGANGAGKTTLLQLLAGEIRASKGEVVVYENNPFVSLKVAQSIFFFRSDTPIASTMTVKRLFKQMKRFYPTWNNELAEKLMAFFQIPTNALVSELSTGKASLIRGLIGICVNCPLTIFDEPTLGMDEPTREAFFRALLKSYLLNPRAIIISSHYISEIDKLCNHFVVINKGRLLISMNKEELEQYAIKISGPKEVIDRATSEKNIVFQEVFAEHHKYVVVANVTLDEVQSYKQKGLTIHSVAIADLCRYLTTEDKGGVHNVY